MRFTSAAFLCAAIAIAAGGQTLAITDVNVIAMVDQRVAAHQTVVTRGDRIVEIGEMSSLALPAGARVIDGRGRYLVPGLIDSHVHIRRADLQKYLAAGITTVRDLAGLDSVLAIAREIERDETSGPQIVTSSLLINGPNPRNPMFSVVIRNREEADAIVADQLARGVRFIKLYENLPRDVYDALIASSRARGALVAGHVSTFVDITHAIESQDSIEHLSGYERAVSRTPSSGDIGAWERVDRARYAELAQLSAAKGVWNCVTLYVYAVLSNFNASIIDNRRAFVRELHERGAHLLAGTDSGYLVPAGTALAEELRELTESGLTPFEALTAATRDAAIFLKMDQAIGTIEPDKRADLVLLNANPLEDIDAVRDPILVIARGNVVWPSRRRAVGR